MSTRLPSRLVRLLAGLVLFGVSVALMVRADLGPASWDVLHRSDTAMPCLTAIVASTRPGRVGRRIGDWFTAIAAERDAFDDVRLAEVGLPFHDEPHHPSERRYLHRHTREWSAAVDAGDGFVSYGMTSGGLRAVARLSAAPAPLRVPA
ncbi:hypothetical protein ACH4OY_08680 [Micromonospora rubida]|uniref:NADPH-dependent FMN reductase-like domain-containing protein n=1 Tax=Micromonospora rubida TaxID=2697657 RepID=A0ABW7SHW2_9ACTN